MTFAENTDKTEKVTKNITFKMIDKIKAGVIV